MSAITLKIEISRSLTSFLIHMDADWKNAQITKE